MPGNLKKRSFTASCGSRSDATHLKPNAVSESAIGYSTTPFSSNVKRSKVDLSGKIPEHNCGFATGVNGRRNEWSVERGILSCPVWAENAVALPAVPLRSVPAINVKLSPGKSVLSHDKDDGHKLANTSDDTVSKGDLVWNHESVKIGAIIAEAKEFINLLDSEDSKPKTFSAVDDFLKGSKESKDQLPSLVSDALHPRTSIGEQKPMMETGKQDKRESDQILAKSVTPRNLEKSLSEKEIRDNSGISVVVQDEKASGTETLSEDDEDDFSILSPAEWNALQLRFNNKDECSEPSTGKLMKKLERGSSLNSNRELINWEIVKHDQPQGRKVMQALKLFEEEYAKILRNHELLQKSRDKTMYPHVEAGARVMAKGMGYSKANKIFGHIPGIEIGDEFSFRAELVIVGLHCQLQAGIDYMELDGKRYATSVVNSGAYENTTSTDGTLIYSGAGGNPKVSHSVAEDQKLVKGNLALSNSMIMRYPVRVINRRKCPMKTKSLSRTNKHNFMYVYDGLYMVENYWQEREDQTHKLVYKFKLQRLPGQPRSCDTAVKLGKQIQVQVGVCVLNDVSQGKEKFPVRVFNAFDADLPPPFTYITKVVYPHWYQHVDPIGCNCIDGCSDSVKCPCVIKNGGEIPFNEKGAICRAKPNVVHECGPSCRCPPSCMNRVSQHSLRYSLEVFKTESMGWGIRSRDFISQGSFICEYVGEMLREKEAEQRIGHDEYLFNVFQNHDGGDGFALDAHEFGNVGRFMNHSCEPNVFSQEIIYDNDDKRVPHIMFFASKGIPPRQELSCDYNYKPDHVRDKNGNIKKKACHCAARKCTGRMY